MIGFAVEHTTKIFLSDGGAHKRRGARGNFPLVLAILNMTVIKHTAFKNTAY